MSSDRGEAVILVTGAGGFLGSHVTRQLVAAGRNVRVLVRQSTNVEGIADLPVDWRFGDILDRKAVDDAVSGCGSIIHCVVNTVAWARNPASMYAVNVDGLINVMDAALRHGVTRFVMTSSIATIGTNPSGVSTEAEGFNFGDQSGEYVRCRVAAEKRFFDYVRERGLPGIAMNVANTYGPGDYAMTPHGRLLAAAAFGQMPFAIDAGMACVGIEDAAEAMVLAEQRGRIGERYIVSERWMTQQQLCEIGADQMGTPKRFRRIPMWLLYGFGFIADRIASVTKRDNQLSVESVRLTHIMNDMDASKARRELGWTPKPVEAAVRAAVDFYKDRRPVAAQ